MDQEIRNKLRNVVTKCRKLLEDSVSQDLEGKYGIFAKRDQVTADPNAPMAHLNEEEQEARKDILDHLGHIQARGFKPKDALDQLVREIAFTHLNRFCAYKMMEAREVYVGGQKFREAVSRGINSNGVKFYLANHPEEERLFNTGHQDVAYRHFLDWLGGLLSEEIGVLFNPNDSANRLYPRQTTIDEVLEMLNSGGIKPEETELREAWPKIWSQDETIGWVYQYFTPKELRDAARDPKKGGSAVPRNSYELAFRNQFFTPRYVVEFLTDNTLGRIWYEMQKGATHLKDHCRYMVRRPNEIFLKVGEQAPTEAAEQRDDLSQEALLKLPVYIPHRPKKDPRELRILDPACGSGHFLLYCFDLLLTIYEEAYTDPELGPALHKDYPTLEELRRQLPGLVLAHNLHGIDIDLRVSQLAALALWLRCQRAYQDMGLKKDRPPIKRSNFACAEPMPGEKEMLKEFVAQLEPKLLGQLVEVVFDKMKLAGEAGSLLKIEEEIRDAVKEAHEQWVRESTLAVDRKGRTLLFSEAEIERLKGGPTQSPLFDVSDISESEFFERAEEEVISALHRYAGKSQNGQRLQRRLFADDAERGLAFVDLCQKRYDVLLMNPPFGTEPDVAKSYIQDSYPDSKNDLYAMFVERGAGLLLMEGTLGAISSRTGMFLSSLRKWRENTLLSNTGLTVLADLGMGVLDTAMVETAAYCISRALNQSGIFLRVSSASDKATALSCAIHSVAQGQANGSIFSVPLRTFRKIPGIPFAYWITPNLLRAFERFKQIEGNYGVVRVGLQTDDDFRFVRLWTEVPTEQIGSTIRDTEEGKTWLHILKGDTASSFYADVPTVVNWRNDGEEVKKWITVALNGGHWSRHAFNTDLYCASGLSWSVRTRSFRPSAVPEGCIFTVSRYLLNPSENGLALLGLLNSSIATSILRLSNERFEHPKYIVGTVQRMPVPELPGPACGALTQWAIESHRIKRMLDASNEFSHAFLLPSLLRSSAISLHSRNDEIERIELEAHKQLSENQRRINEVAFQLYSVTSDETGMDDVEGCNADFEC